MQSLVWCLSGWGPWPLTSSPNIFLLQEIILDIALECSSFVCLVYFVYIMLCVYVCVWSYIFSVMCHVCRISAVHSCVMFSVSCLFCSVCVCVPVLVQKLLGPLCVLISQDQLLSRQDSFENLLSKKTKMNQRQISHSIRNGPSPTRKLKRYLPVFWGFGGRVLLLEQMTNCQDWSPWKAGSEVPSAAVSHVAVFCSHTRQVDAFNKRPTFYLSSDVGIKAASWPRLPSLCSWGLREGPQLLDAHTVVLMQILPGEQVSGTCVQRSMVKLCDQGANCARRGPERPWEWHFLAIPRFHTACLSGEISGVW